MSDLHQFPDSFARMIDATRHHADDLDLVAFNGDLRNVRACLELHDIPTEGMDHGVARIALEALAHQLREDASTWSSLLYNARIFADNIAGAIDR